MSEKKFITTDFTWGFDERTFRLLGFWADSNVWDSSDPLHGIKFSYIDLKTGVVIEDVVHSETRPNIKEAIEKELVKVFPKRIPKREIGLTVEEIGEIIRDYTDNWYNGSSYVVLRGILDKMNLVPKNG